VAERRQHTPAERAQVVSFALAHGPRAAARRFGVPLGTVKGWTHRHKHPPRRRPPRRPPVPAAPVPTAATTSTEVFDEQARRLAAWAAGGCLTCANDGTITVPATYRGSLLIRAAKTIPCPTCGGRPIRIQVNELPRGEWAAGMARAGDLGIGWSPESWARIRAGEVHPDGRRFTELEHIERRPRRKPRDRSG
jgi:transposase-like protein